MSLTIHARAKSDLTQKLNGAGLQHASPNSSQHMGAALPFQYDGVDAVSIENMGQQQAGWATADDCRLGSRRHFHRPLSQRGMSSVGNAQSQKLAIPRVNGCQDPRKAGV